MRDQRRDLLAATIAIIAFVLGLAALAPGRLETGIHLRVDGDLLVVDSVDAYSRAALDRIEPGMVVAEMNDTEVLRLPQYTYAEPTQEQMDAGEPPTITGIEPAVPTPGVGAGVLQSLADTPIWRLGLVRRADLSATDPSMYGINGYFYPLGEPGSVGSIGILAGIGILVGGSLLLRSARAGESVRPLALPIAVATATPFLVQPMAATWNLLAVAVAGVLATLAMVPLADGLVERIETGPERRMITIAVVFCSTAAIVVVIAMVQVNPNTALDFVRWGLIAAIPVLPGLAAAGPINLETWRAPSSSSGRLLQSTELAVTGATPALAVGTVHDPGYWSLILWLLALAVAGRFTVRPLARLVTRAQLQRDLIVAATEAERARLAADIHDEALQELTLLVRRLEVSGDIEGAELGRTVAERLRAICGDLRLPILDDLGVGPALDWLVLRIERLAGGEVRLERTDGTRPPPDVELAIFRVAQEALANAVKHGQPPIVVRYHSTATGASLSIDDAGPGISADAGATAERGGHFGLLNMQQRAEQIGAILDVRRWPSGGTHVALEWRAR
jgi:signal transduction histidine kinase